MTGAAFLVWERDDMFVHETAIRLFHTDAAGVIFFARLFHLFHQAYEALLEELGHPLPPDMAHTPITLPIVHASADYRAPLRLNDRVRIEIALEKLGHRSYTLAYRLLKGETLAAQGRTTHVCLDRATGHARSLPDDLSAALARLSGGRTA